MWLTCCNAASCRQSGASEKTPEHGHLLTSMLQHSLVGSVEKRGISGGQRKRVSIGVELVAKPSLLFMDEPTSGLDATAATDILVSLRK